MSEPALIYTTAGPSAHPADPPSQDMRINWVQFFTPSAPPLGSPTRIAAVLRSIPDPNLAEGLRQLLMSALAALFDCVALGQLLPLLDSDWRLIYAALLETVLTPDDGSPSL